MKVQVVCIVLAMCCSLFASSTAQFTCAQYDLWGIAKFDCRSGNECVLKRFECDSILDCRDFSDEDHCETQHKENCELDFAGKKTIDGSPLESFQCINGMCILGCQRCDGTVDCADLSDEIGCTGNEAKSPCQ